MSRQTCAGVHLLHDQLTAGSFVGLAQPDSSTTVLLGIVYCQRHWHGHAVYSVSPLRV
jgi:hypothetical protein